MDNTCQFCAIAANNHIAAESKTKKNKLRTIYSGVLSVLIAFFPKCPVCWAVYMSALGGLGITQIPYMGWLLPILVSLMCIHLFLLYRKINHEGYIPFVLSIIGTSTVLLCRLLPINNKLILFIGMACIIGGSLWSSFSLSRRRVVLSHQ